MRAFVADGVEIAINAEERDRVAVRFDDSSFAVVEIVRRCY
jgi:hypothetical protein